ncbi:hypothetical protein EVAR_72782_1 [Eumeta japonica]|uniref:RNase H type-1 domain-containing protein n=1 Tax=Eumeta variegata TaxID=151549 RepID=A0A4C1T8B2_EUMVA|nr:hypothetical protein EVAR_72782_1 [Eumeta japonica]
MCFRLPDGCSILQAEISAIRRAAKWLTFHRIFDFDILIITDSQAAIKSLTWMYTTSSLVQECLESLNEMARHTNVTPMDALDMDPWQLHNVDERGTTLSEEDITPFCGLPSVCWEAYWGQLLECAQQRWSLEPTCFSSRGLWPRLDLGRTGCYWDSQEHILGLLCRLSPDIALSGTAGDAGLPLTTSVEVVMTWRRQCYISLVLVGRWRTFVLGFCREGSSMTCPNLYSQFGPPSYPYFSFSLFDSSSSLTSITEFNRTHVSCDSFFPFNSSSPT